jgi:zinc transporter ZupT
VLPFVGTLMQATTFAAAALLTAILAPLTIAIAWLFYRPMISLGVLAGGAALVFAVSKMIAARPRRTADRAAQPGPAAR